MIPTSRWPALKSVPLTQSALRDTNRTLAAMVQIESANGPIPALAGSRALHSGAEQGTEYSPLRPPFGFLRGMVSA
jgi:hypothetical protein